jgi:hypothetical protein
MKSFLNTRILMLVLVVMLGILPAAAAERLFGLKGNGNVTFLTDEAGNVTGGTLTASGAALHLGHWTAVGVLSFTPDADDPNLIRAAGTETFTAANGDKLNVVVTDAVLNTTTGIGTGVFRFEGGTGRFADASRSASFVVVQNLVTGAFKVDAIGVIDF